MCDSTTSPFTTPSTSQVTTPCATFTKGGNANNAMCVFPFIYKGTTYYKCTTINNGDTPWCATTSSYDADEQWGNCAGK